MQNDQVIEVILREKMTVKRYKPLIAKVKKKGWEVQGYPIGFYQDGLKNKL